MLVLVDEQFLFEAPRGQCLNGVGQFPVIRFRARFEEAEVVFRDAESNRFAYDADSYSPLTYQLTYG
jgi:hypothetical protein